MGYKISKADIQKMFENEESIEIDIKKIEHGEFLIRLTTDSGLTKIFITDNWEELFAN